MILTDPVDYMGFHILPGTTADIVTVSHEHANHDSVEPFLKGKENVRKVDDSV